MGRLAPPVLLDDNSDGTPDRQFYVVQRYRDYYLPSLTLTLALRYFNRSPSEIEVVIGEHITIPQPQKFNTETGAWEAYRIETKQAVFNDSGEMLQAPEYREVPEIRIPIDRHGSMLINFMGPSSGDALSSYQTFPVRSYSGYASRATGPDKKTWPATMALGNKIILAGIFSPGTATDEKKTPFGIMYGIEIHANALNTILMDRFIQPLSEVQSALILLLVCLLVAFYAGRLKTPLALALTLVSIIAFTLSVTILFDFMSILIDFAVPSMAMLFTLIAIIVYRIMTEEKEKQRIQSMFGKYVSKTVVDQMVEAGEQPELGGVDKELTVLFSDIRGFTTLSESMTPQELVNHLNAYLTAMTDIIMEYQGTLDKYVGDEVMCFWGAPVAQADHAILACRCALRQMEKLAELNAAWPPERRIDIGIGLNSGIMTVGNMGSIGRMNYTLMGDNVNLGARLEGTNKQYYTHIIISEYTYGLVKDKVIVRELDNIRVKGKNKPVLIYELIDVID
jgi:adenylate cyclase